MDKVFSEPGFICSPMGPTRECGVYAICVTKVPNWYPPENSKTLVVYIGSSNQIHKRVMHNKHPYRRLYSILKGYFVSCFYLECSEFLDLEKRLIKKYSPRFNRHHNG